MKIEIEISDDELREHILTAAGKALFADGEVYPSASFAAKKLGLIDSSVAKVCRGKYKHTGGMVFRYV